MKLRIDNLDGLGLVDYSGTISVSPGKGAAGSAALKVVRGLNVPSTLDAEVCLEGSSLATPVRRGRVEVASDAGAVLFTGYLTTEAVPVYAGEATHGAVYRLALRAVSDEWLLDKQTGLTRMGAGLAAPSGVLLKSLVGRLGSGGLLTAGVPNGRPVGVYEPEAAAAWSANAGELAGGAYEAYRVLNGAMTLAPAGGVTHALSDGDGTLNIAALRTASVRELANDVTLSGAMEPLTYWTELFQGDGTTTVFDLTGEPDAVNGGHALLIRDRFELAAIDRTTWAVLDPGSFLGLSGGIAGSGLTLRGGNGLDGQTTLTAIDAMEMGGTLVVELAGVTLGAGSAGVLGGLYQGSTMQANCFAGFNVRQASGQTVLVPLVDGVEVGTVFPLLSGHSYTLRLRLHCPELLRIKQTYYASNDASGSFQVEQFGGGLVAAPMFAVFEVRDLGLSSNTPATVLYDGGVASTPASCSLVAVNSVQLIGSVGSVRVDRTGTGWVRSAAATTGTVTTKLVGAAGEGADCKLSPGAAGSLLPGKLTFFAGRAPAAGEVVSVSYRGRRRAVARLADAASVATEAAGGAQGTARWLGHVGKPPARSSEDCEAAAAAVLSFATSRAAAVAGSYTAVNPAGGDIWPGDVLVLAAQGSGIRGIVRRVTIAGRGASPEVLTYSIAFANDWAEGLGLTLSEAIAKDALLPVTAVDSSVNEAARVLQNLQQMAVSSTTSANAALLVDAGIDPPAGGGFEVRRRDGGFGQGTSDLVLRSPVRGFSIPVAAVEEEFFVRMYDASAPPLYSRVSSGIVTHLPIG